MLKILISVGYRANGLEGYLSDFPEINPLELSNDTSLCFKNIDYFSDGLYRTWRCQVPYPFGRFLVLYLSTGIILNLIECEAYGIKYVSLDYLLLPRIKSDKNSVGGNPQYQSRFQHSIRIMDNNLDTEFRNHLNLGCTGAIDTIESKISLYFDKIYEINQVIICPSRLKGYFKL